MGAVLAQLLAAQGLARALVLVAPAARSGILPQTEAEKKLDQDLIGLGAFWKTVINPDFDLARVLTLNRVPEAEQRAVFDKFGPESGRAFFELFFWMFDRTGATAVDTKSVRCPVLCLAGADDNLASVASARATAEGYPGAPLWSLRATAICSCSNPAHRRLDSGLDLHSSAVTGNSASPVSSSRNARSIGLNERR
jgi:non-heme chloroperoxidase